jgi:hypothetical protein
VANRLMGTGRVYVRGKPVGEIGYVIEATTNRQGRAPARGLASTTSDALKKAHAAGGGELEFRTGTLSRFRIDVYDDSTSSLVFVDGVPGLD